MVNFTITDDEVLNLIQETLEELLDTQQPQPQPIINPELDELLGAEIREDPTELLDISGINLIQGIFADDEKVKETNELLFNMDNRIEELELDIAKGEEDVEELNDTIEQIQAEQQRIMDNLRGDDSAGRTILNNIISGRPAAQRPDRVDNGWSVSRSLLDIKDVVDNRQNIENEFKDYLNNRNYVVGREKIDAGIEVFFQYYLAEVLSRLYADNPDEVDRMYEVDRQDRVRRAQSSYRAIVPKPDNMEQSFRFMLRPYGGHSYEDAGFRWDTGDNELLFDTKASEGGVFSGTLLSYSAAETNRNRHIFYVKVSFHFENGTPQNITKYRLRKGVETIRIRKVKTNIEELIEEENENKEEISILVCDDVSIVSNRELNLDYQQAGNQFNGTSLRNVVKVDRVEDLDDNNLYIWKLRNSKMVKYENLLNKQIIEIKNIVDTLFN